MISLRMHAQKRLFRALECSTRAHNDLDKLVEASFFICCAAAAAVITYDIPKQPRISWYTQGFVTHNGM